MFNSFIVEYGKTYKSGSEEYQIRFETFKQNMALAAERNKAELAAGGGACNGVTKFSDGSVQYSKGFIAPGSGSVNTKTLKLRYKATASIPACFTGSVCDWTGILTTPLRNQGSCGSCWAFSAAEQIETDAIRLNGWGGGPGTKSNPIPSTAWLSAQQITSCDKTDYGCNGGNTETAFSYVQASPIEPEAVYPYIDGGSSCNSNVWCASTCTFNAAKEAVAVTGYYTLSPSDEATMQSYITSTGPLSICLSASDWSTYKCSTASSGSCIKTTCNTDIDHCVQLVGYAPAGSYAPQSSLAYWIIRNQWGTGWGVNNNGYMWLQYGKNLCVINTDPQYTITSLVGATASPSMAPVTARPSSKPTPSSKPSFRPSLSPSLAPTVVPSPAPTYAPTKVPTNAPVTMTPTTTIPTYTGCPADSTNYIGDGVCDSVYNNAACVWDGGDLRTDLQPECCLLLWQPRL